VSDVDDLDDNQVDNEDDDDNNNNDDDDDENVDDNFDDDDDSFIEENSLNESTHSNGGNAGLGSKTKKTSKKHGKKSKHNRGVFSLGNGLDSSSPMSSSSLLQINSLNNRFLAGHSNHVYGHHLHNHHHHHSGSSKPARIRTVLNEKQLHMLRACYNANPRPDALMKEHLVEMTGLNPRVIRVWFQNKRCKDKKKNLLVRPEHSLQLPTIHHASSSPFNHSHMVNNLTNNQNSLMFDNCY
jgi:hypothetical protein